MVAQGWPATGAAQDAAGVVEGSNDAFAFPVHRLAIFVNDDHFFGVGGEVGSAGSRWAAHGRASLVSAAPLLALGSRRTVLRARRTEVNVVGLAGIMSCLILLDGPCPIEARAEAAFKPAVGATAQVNAFGLGGALDWAAGLEVGYVRRFADGADPGFDLWTFGFVILRGIKSGTNTVRTRRVPSGS